MSGTGLGSRAFTYDGFGRLSTATDGRGNTITYSYDDADRIKKVDYSDTGTHDVTFSYDAENRLTQRVDGSGTTTWTYDDLGRMLSVVNTAGGGTETYRYDLAGALASKADTSGTTTYTYSAGHRVISMSYPQSGNNLIAQFGYDSAGRRQDVWMQSNGLVPPTTWAAHEHTTYDTSGRVTAVLGQEGPAGSPTTVVNQTACYNTGSAAPTCGTGSTGDQAKLQFIIDSVSGETATFGYDDHGTGQGQTGRLLKTTITGGTNPRVYTYGYNAAGDRTSASVTGTSPASQALTFNNGNQITSAGYGYDAAGNQTTDPAGTAAFNTAAQQTSVVRGGVTTSYTYAGTNSDELLTESTPSGHTYGLTYGRADQSGLPEIEQVEYDSNTAYVQHDPTTGSPLMLQTNSGISCLYMTNIVDNPILLSTSVQTTSFAESYDPYGSATQTSDGGNPNNGGISDNPYLFHFGLQDRITGDVKFGGRFYDPTTGTWTQQDTYNAPLSPGNANRYLYAGGDPINVSDPLGLGFWDDVEEIAGDEFAGLVGCGSGILAVDDTGIGEAATAAGGPIGGAAANVIGCAVGYAAGYAGGGTLDSNDSGD